MAKTVKQRGRKAPRRTTKKKKKAAPKRAAPASNKRRRKRTTVKDGDGPLFVIDSQEEGIRTLTEYGLCPAPRDIVEVDSWSHLQSVTADLAEQGHDQQGFGKRSAVQILLYGPAGVGKTSFAANFPPNTVVFDSLTGFEKLCFQHHCEEHFDGDWSKDNGFYAYSKGPKQAAKTDWPEWLDGLNAVRQAGVNVVLLAHSTPPKEYNNPDGPNYDRYHVYLDKETWSQTHRWSKAVLFYNYSVEVDKKGTRAKARPDTEERFIYTQWSPAFDAKNQYNLEPLLDAGESGEDAYKAFAEPFFG